MFKHCITASNEGLSGVSVEGDEGVLVVVLVPFGRPGPLVPRPLTGEAEVETPLSLRCCNKDPDEKGGLLFKSVSII